MELLRALGSLVEEPAPEHRGVARALGLPEAPSPAAHQRVVASQRWPFASVYLDWEGMLGGEARDRIAGFRRALGLERRPGLGRARDASVEVDHLAMLLDLLASLDEWREIEFDDAKKALLSRARATLTWEHLTPWIRAYLASFADCRNPFYAAWAALLGRAIDSVEQELTNAGEFPESLPAALRGAPGLPDPRRAGGDAFAAGLLAPVRAGMVLVRDDLTRLAAEAGLACRAGERRYALAGLLSQAPAETLGWLAGRAEEWRDRLADRGPARIAQWWSSRAAESARLLSQLAVKAAFGGSAAARFPRAPAATSAGAGS